jgi:hypothetical protein
MSITVGSIESLPARERPCAILDRDALAWQQRIMDDAITHLNARVDQRQAHLLMRCGDETEQVSESHCGR